MKQTELVVVSFPVAGHLLVTIELVKRLINHDRRIDTVTIFQWKLPFAPQADLLAQSLTASEPRINFISLPDIHDPPPLELSQKAPEAYIFEFVKKIAPLFRNALKTIMSSHDGSDSVRVVGLLLDFFFIPLIDVGNEMNIPSYIFLTCGAGFLSMMKYLPERHRNISSEFDRSSSEEELQIPSYINPVPTKVFPPGLFIRESYEAYIELAEKFPDAKGILVNSFVELESRAFDYFSRLEDYPTVYPVGPILSLRDRPNPNSDSIERERMMIWLDDQPESSVVFLCFGSFGVLGGPQIKEIAQALEFVGCKFLWSIRTNPVENTSLNDLLPDGFLDRTAGRGVVCGWAPQEEILAHKATGWFVSHCGWNSTLESLWFGVPIATWPMYAEQQLNAFTMTKELGLAVELRLDFVLAHGEIVGAEEIARALRSLMDGGDEQKKKVKEMKEAARRALMDGGSSFSGITAFLGKLLDVDG